MKRTAFLMIALAAGAALAAAQHTHEHSRTFVGVITDTMCGADHSPMGIRPDAQCVVECVKTDKTVKYALYDGKNIYVLSDQKTPEKFAARKVKVTGVLYEKTRMIKVEKIEPAG